MGCMKDYLIDVSDSVFDYCKLYDRDFYRILDAVVDLPYEESGFIGYNVFCRIELTISCDLPSLQNYVSCELKNALVNDEAARAKKLRNLQAKLEDVAKINNY